METPNDTVPAARPTRFVRTFGAFAPGVELPTSSPGRRPVEPVRVLVADDSDLHRELTLIHLGEAWPFDRKPCFECAADGREALEKLCRRCYALAVLDWRMPHLTGGDVLRAIREDGMRIPVVVVSGEERGNIARDLQAMAAAFVSKAHLNPLSLRDAISESVRLPGIQWSV